MHVQIHWEDDDMQKWVWATDAKPPPPTVNLGNILCHQSQDLIYELKKWFCEWGENSGIPKKRRRNGVQMRKSMDIGGEIYTLNWMANGLVSSLGPSDDVTTAGNAFLKKTGPKRKRSNIPMWEKGRIKTIWTPHAHAVLAISQKTNLQIAGEGKPFEKKKDRLWFLLQKKPRTP